MSKNDPCVKAVEFANLGKTNEALAKVTRCKKTIQKNIKKASGNLEVTKGLQKQLAKVLKLEAQLYLSKNVISKSINLYDQSLRLLEKLPADEENIYLKGHVNYSQALILFVQNHLEEAILKYQSSREYFVSIKYFSEYSEITLRMIDILMQIQKLEEAWSYSKELEKIIKKIKDKERKKSLWPKLYQVQSKIKFGQTDQKEGLKLLSKAKKEFEKSDNFDGSIEVLLNQYRMDSGLTNELKEDLLLEALELTNITGNKEYMGTVESELGIMALKAGQFEKGKTRLLRGLKLKTEVGDKSGTAQSLIELSRITLLTAQKNHDLQKAENFAKQALELYSEITNEYGRAQSFELIGTIATRLENLDEALEVLRAGRKIFKKYKDKNSEGRTLTQIGIVLDLKNNKEESLVVLNKAGELYSQTQNIQGLAEVLQLKGNVTENKVEAFKSYSKSKELYQQIIGDREELKPILFSLDVKIKELSD